MGRKYQKFVNAFVAVFMFASVLSLTGCGTAEDTDLQTDIEELSVDLEVQQETPEVRTDADIARTQENGQEHNGEAGSVMRAYSDKEQERMKELQESYQNETAKPENMIQEIDSAGEVMQGTLCYIRSTGEYYLPDRELTDEELLQIIDCNFRIAVNTNRKTKAQWDAETRAERAELEDKVKAAGGISEEKAVEIAKKAMETDLGEKAGELELCVDESFGWSSDLCVADWSEIKETDKGALAYTVGFNNAKTVTEMEDLCNYNCTVNAMDGSILEAYTIEGWDHTVYYEH